MERGLLGRLVMLRFALLAALLVPSLARADEPPGKSHDVEIGEPMAIAPPAQLEVAQVAPSPPPDESLGVSLYLGHDLTWSRGSSEGSPALGTLELGMFGERGPLAYATFRSVQLGGAGTYLIEKARGQAIDPSRTQACWYCIAGGMRVLRGDRGTLTAGVHLERIYVGDEFDFLVNGFGGELGYFRREGRYFGHVVVGASKLRKASEWFGSHVRAEAFGMARLIGPLAVYARLGYAEGSFEGYEFGGPIVGIGMALVSP